MLKDIQNDFVDNIQLDGVGAPPQIAETDNISAHGRMSIYRNNYFAAILQAMELTYPTIKKLVGEKFFAYTVRQYLKKYHPASGNLDEYGAEFNIFLQSFAPASQLEYLPDIAKMEWLFHQSSIAHKGATLDAQAFASIPQEQYFNLSLKLHNSVQLMNSQYPIDKIWESNQVENQENNIIDLDASQGVNLLFIRKYLKTDILILENAEYQFLLTIYEYQRERGKNTKNKSNNFYQAFNQACAVNEHFDLEYYLKKHINNGTISGFVLDVN